MKKIVVLLVGVLYGLGLYAQTPDSTGVVVCEIPGVLDTLRNETPVCPTLGVTTVALDEEGVQVVFRTPMVGGERFDRLEGHFVLAIDGIAGSFSVDGAFTSGNTILEGSVRVTTKRFSPPRRTPPPRCRTTSCCKGWISATGPFM